MVTIEKFKEIAEKHGYKIEKITRFRHRDRIRLSKENLTITLYLKKKLEQLTVEELEQILK